MALLNSAAFPQREVGISFKKQKAFVTDFRAPFELLFIDIDQNNFIETENLILPVSVSTKVVNKKDKPLDRNLIRPGMQIEITGERFNDRIEVTNIKLLTDLEKWEVEVKGYFESLDGDKAWVGGQAVKLEPGTVIRGKDDWKGKTFASFNDMQLGSQLKIDGIRRADGIVYVKGGEAEPNQFTGGDRKMLELVKAGMLVPTKLEGGKGKVAGREVTFANDLELQKYVNKIGNKLVPRYEKDLPGDYPGKRVYRFAVIEDESFNAFALPDGSIFIHTGLLKQIKNEAQLASIIGHEIAHVTHEHGRKHLEGAEKRQWLVLMAAIGGAMTGSREIAAAGIIAVGALQNKYGRNEEDQADRVGLYYMTQAGYDPRESPKVWREISKNTKQNAVSNFLYSDHSTARSRLKNLNREIAYNYYDTNFANAKIGAEEYKNSVGPHLGWLPKSNNSNPSAVNAGRPLVTSVKNSDGFATFFAKFKQAVLANNRSSIRNMMAQNFEWALDGYGSREEALSNMDQMKFWPGLRNAVLRKPVACKQPFCNNRPGYRTWSSRKYFTEIMFERDGNGVWHWTAMLGD